MKRDIMSLVSLLECPPHVRMKFLTLRVICLGSLRAASNLFPEEWTEHLKGNKYTNLVYAAGSAVRKLSFVSAIPPARFPLLPPSVYLPLPLSLSWCKVSLFSGIDLFHI